MSASSSHDPIEPLIAQIGRELARRGPHLRLLRQILLLQDRLNDSRLDQELLLLLQELPVEALEPELAERLRFQLKRLLPDLNSSLQAYAPWLTALLAAERSCQELFQDPLFKLLMSHCYLLNPVLEQKLTHLRRKILLNQTDAEPEMLSLLSQQCQLNGFVWAVSHEEEQALDKLSADPEQVQLLACYQPLKTEYSESEIPSLTAIPEQDPCYRFYSESPYPRWLAPERLTIEPLPEQLQALFNLSIAEPQDVLVAGCGTGQQLAQLALQLPQAKLTGIDLSLKALEYAAKRLSEHQLKADLFQADLLALHHWVQRFDLISCGGVLHHLEDPLAGLKVLAGLLKPNGLLKLGVYSQRARKPVWALREAYGITGQESPEQVRAIRSQLLTDPSEAAQWLRGTHDFYTLETCRDLLFHPREQAFSLPALAPWLTECQLELIGPELWQPGFYKLFDQMFPHLPYSDLQAWDQLEANHPSLFAGLMVLWLRPKTERPVEIRHDEQRDDEWMRDRFWL